MKNTLILIALLIVAVSCNSGDEYKLSPEQALRKSESAASDNNQIITNAEEILDITGEVLASEGLPHGRSHSGKNLTSGRACDPAIDRSYLIDRTHYDTVLFVGTMTIDYGDGDSCESGTVRKGKVVDNFIYILNTETELFSSKETITFEGYQKDSISIDGEFLILAKSNEPVTLRSDEAKVIYSDGTELTWKGELNFVSRNVDPDTGESASKNISGYMEGTTRRKEKFVAQITAPIEYNYECTNAELPVPVKGTVVMNVNDEITSVEYGDGDCDNTYIIGYDGKIKNYQF